MKTMPLSSELRLSTQPAHRSIEASPFFRALARGELSVESYEIYLCQLLSIHQAFADSRKTLIEWDTKLDNLLPDSLSTLGKLREDLSELTARRITGLEPRGRDFELRACRETHMRSEGRVRGRVDFFNGLLGVLDDGCPLFEETTALIHAIRAAAAAGLSIVGPIYVFEGAKNGGRILSRHLSDLGLPCLHLNPDGALQPERWRRFKLAIDRIECSAAERDQIVSTANQTFGLLEAVGSASLCFENDLQD